MLIFREKMESISNQIDLNWRPPAPLSTKMNDKRFDKQLSLKIHGSNEANDENEDEKRAGRSQVQSINQSVGDRFIPISPRNAPHLCHNTDTGNQSIRWGPGADLQFGLQSLFRIFTHRPNWGVFGLPANISWNLEM